MSLTGALITSIVLPCGHLWEVILKENWFEFSRVKLYRSDWAEGKQKRKYFKLAGSSSNWVFE